MVSRASVYCTVTYPLALSSCAAFSPLQNVMNGVFTFNAPTLATITDGTSNTFLYSEKANGMFSKNDAANGGANDSNCYNWWADASRVIRSSRPCTHSTHSGRSRSSRTNTISPGSRARRVSIPAAHNFAFADGSVRFIKESISSWQFNPANGYPQGVTVQRQRTLYARARHAGWRLSELFNPRGQ